MNSKLVISLVIILVFTFLGCKNDYEKEVETSKMLVSLYKKRKLPNYDSVYNKIIVKGKSSLQLTMLADSLHRNTKEANVFIDSLITVIEKMD